MEFQQKLFILLPDICFVNKMICFPDTEIIIEVKVRTLQGLWSDSYLWVESGFLL